MTEQASVKVIRERRPKTPKIILRTTPEIIERAIPANSGHCIWADAVQEAWPDAQRVSVDLQTIRFTDPKRGHRYTYLTPRTVQVDLVNFDQGIKPEPTSVRIQGGQVTRANPRKNQKKVVRGRGNAAIPSRATLATRDDGKGKVMDRIGGKTPPIGAFAHAGGQRRQFGLRGLGRVSPKDAE